MDSPKRGGADVDDLASLVANLDIVATALDDPRSLAQRLQDVRDRVRAAREAAEHIRGAQSQYESLAPAARPPHPFRILVVDDDIALGSSLARTLRRYDVVVLDNARDALARFTGGERFDLVISDLVMPDMTGMGLYEETLRLSPEQAQAFVFVTAGARTPEGAEFLATVPNAVLTKPFDVNRLREIVRHREGLLRRSKRLVMVVDDDDDTRKLVVQWLTAADFECVEHHSSAAALDALIADPDRVDVVVHDVMMPGIDGFRVVARLKASAATAHIPIILLTAQAIGESDVARGVDAGATCYLTKPFSGPVLVSQVRSVCARADAEREVRTRLHLAEEQATRDALTGAVNRRGFEARLAEAIANTARHREPLALVMLDLDHFKQLNDTFGHAGGDHVLLYFARALRRGIRRGDQAFRYGGEEFALLLPKCDADGALRVVTRIQQDLRARPAALREGGSVVVRFSAGIATAEEINGFRVEQLVARADAALYTAKNSGRDRVDLEAGRAIDASASARLDGL